MFHFKTLLPLPTVLNICAVRLTIISAVPSELSRFCETDVAGILVPDIQLHNPGITFTLNDTQYITSLKICLNVNERFPKDTLEKGHYNLMERKDDNYCIKNVPLICTNKSIELNVGDKVYYWIAAEDNNLCRHLKEDQSFTVVKDEYGQLVAKNTTSEDFEITEEHY